MDADGPSWSVQPPILRGPLETLGHGDRREGRMTAIAACRTCGTEPREGARDCDACGSLIAPATEQAEYKQVTLLVSLAVYGTNGNFHLSG